MTRFWPGSEITLQAFVRDEDGVLTNASAVAFFWRMRHWRDSRSDETGSVSNTATGTYEVTFTPQDSGNCYFRWEITTPNLIQEGAINIKDSQFPGQI